MGLPVQVSPMKPMRTDAAALTETRCSFKKTVSYFAYSVRERYEKQVFGTLDPEKRRIRSTKSESDFGIVIVE